MYRKSGSWTPLSPIPFGPASCKKDKKCRIKFSSIRTPKLGGCDDITTTMCASRLVAIPAQGPQPNKQRSSAQNLQLQNPCNYEPTLRLQTFYPHVQAHARGFEETTGGIRIGFAGKRHHFSSTLGGDGIRCMFNREWVGVSVVLSGYGGNVSTAPLDPFAKTFGF
jgi:hypothetical protein